MTTSTNIDVMAEINRIDGLVNRIDKKFGTSPDERMGIRSGFSTFDQRTRGFHGGKLYTAAGRPGAGKTSFATSIMANMVKFQKFEPVIMFSTELPEDEIIMQIIEAYSNGVPVYPNGRMSSEDETDILRASLSDVRHQLVSGLLKIIYDKRLSMKFIYEQIDRHCDKALGGAGAFVIIDQANRIRREDKDRHGYAIATEHMLNGMEQITAQQDVPLLLLTQLNRGAENESPTMAHLKHSGAFEEFSHAVFLMEKCKGHGRSEPGSAFVDNGATVHIAKNRHGSVGPIDFNFTGESHHWTEKTGREEA